MTEHTPLPQDSCRTEAVLRALGHAEPDDALQGRLIAALHAAHTQRGVRPRWHANVVQANSFGRWLVLAACLLTIVGTTVHQFTLHRRPATGSAAAYAAPRWDHPHAAATTVIAPGTAIRHQRRDAAISLTSPAAVASSAPARLTLFAVAQPTHSRIRLREVDTVSFPPPPLPMTAQERLLLRLQRREPAAQLAQLTRPARDAIFQRDKDAVTEFFAPAPPLRSQQEPPSDPDEPAGQP